MIHEWRIILARKGSILLRQMLLVMLACVSLMSCTGEGCVDADDFGFPKLRIDARGYDVQGTNENQFSKWIHSKFEISGQRLVIVVRNGKKSRWCPWFGKSGKFDYPVLDNLLECQFNTGMCPSGDPDNCDKEGDFSNKPCFLTKGKGLYALVTDPSYAAGPNNPNSPNANPQTIIDPTANIGAVTQHMGETDSNTDHRLPAGGYNDSPDSFGAKVGGVLYFKILDNYYTDNVGGYDLVLKSGIRDREGSIFVRLIETVDKHLDKAAERIYIQLTQHFHFVEYVRAVLTIYFIFVSIGFIFGLTRMTQAEMLMIMLKISVIVAVMSPGSWEFFNGYLFELFTAAPMTISNMLAGVGGGVVDSTATADGMNYTSTANTALFLDQLWHNLTSSETQAKIWSQLVETVPGLLFMMAFYFACFLLLIASIKAVIFYSLSQMALAVIIVVAPIFMTFMLFSGTRQLFQNWITQAISWTLQGLMGFAFIIFLGTMVMTILHDAVGYRVCLKPIFPAPFNTVLPFKMWKPDIEDIPGEKTEIQVPEAFIVPQTGVNCAAFECTQARYYDMPYLEPENTESGERNDQGRIDELFRGDYFSAMLTFLLVLLTYLCYRMANMMPSIARSIAGAGFTWTQVDGVARQLWDGASSAAIQAIDYGYKPLRGHSLQQDIIMAKKVIRDPLVRGQNFMADQVDKVKEKGTAIKDKATFGLTKEWRESVERGRDFRHEQQDRIGGRIEGMMNLYDMYKEHAKHEFSFGMGGTDIHKPNKFDNDKSVFDKRVEYFKAAYGMNQEQGVKIDENLKDIATSISNFKQMTKAGAIASIVNPAVGLGIIGFSATKEIASTTVDAYKTYLGIKEATVNRTPPGSTPPTSTTSTPGGDTSATPAPASTTTQSTTTTTTAPATSTTPATPSTTNSSAPGGPAAPTTSNNPSSTANSTVPRSAPGGGGSSGTGGSGGGPAP